MHLNVFQLKILRQRTRQSFGVEFTLEVEWLVLLAPVTIIFINTIRPGNWGSNLPEWANSITENYSGHPTYGSSARGLPHLVVSFNHPISIISVLSIHLLLSTTRMYHFIQWQSYSNQALHQKCWICNMGPDHSWHCHNVNISFPWCISELGYEAG